MTQKTEWVYYLHYSLSNNSSVFLAFNNSGFIINMKIKFLLLTFCFFVFIAQDVEAQRQQWSYVGDSTEGIEFYVDKSFRRLSATNVQFWEKRIFTDGHQILLTEVNCDEKKIRYHQSVSYNLFGEVIESLHGTGKWTFATPESVGEFTVNVVCRLVSRRTTTPKVSSKNNLAQIITDSANLRESPNASSSIIREVALDEKLVLADAEPIGAWYKVIDAKTKSEGWLHGNTFKIVTVQKKQTKGKRTKRN